MSFNVLPFASRPTVERASLPESAAGDLIDLASRRVAPDAIPAIPDAVLDEVDAAARLWDELHAENREIRFDPDAASERISASLREIGGGIVRSLPLREAVGYDDDGPQSAA